MREEENVNYQVELNIRVDRQEHARLAWPVAIRHVKGCSCSSISASLGLPERRFRSSEPSAKGGVAMAYHGYLSVHGEG